MVPHHSTKMRITDTSFHTWEFQLTSQKDTRLNQLKINLCASTWTIEKKKKNWYQHISDISSSCHPVVRVLFQKEKNACEWDLRSFSSLPRITGTSLEVLVKDFLTVLLILLLIALSQNIVSSLILITFFKSFCVQLWSHQGSI